MDHDFTYNFIEPDIEIADFVENLGTFRNLSDQAKEVVIIPDGRIDLFSPGQLQSLFMLPFSVWKPILNKGILLLIQLLLL
ncbi:hypothetical protein OWR28_15160 [Chryseobacterium sp. 1B4]